ncbi:MAG: cobalamin biosynthesis protein CbiX [Verrucomicrobia bacterium]|nr:MAG: cobalamin biosynthesis protein CbiX [Verrucomicrobiota bacterium]
MKPDICLSNAALIIVGHGSTVNPDSSLPTHVHAATIRKRRIFRETVCCFWKEEPSMREVYHMLESKEVYIVPNFISEGYFTQTVIPRELELQGALTRKEERTIKYCPPVGSHPKMTELLLRQVAKVAPGVPSEQTTLIIAGHGTDLNENSAKAVKKQVAQIRGRYAEVIAAYMDDVPKISDWALLATQPNVVIVPFFISDGLHSYQDIPVMLGITSEPSMAASQTEVFRHNPYELRGKKLFYASAIGTEPAFAEVILDQVYRWNPNWRV